MCDVPPRRWQDTFKPARLLAALVALVILGVGTQLPPGWDITAIVFGAVLLLGAVMFPVVREIEFGLPVGIKVKAALRDRENDLREAFDSHRGELELCTHLLCDDPSVAAELLEASWSRTVANWRGPISADIRIYVLCVFAQLLAGYQRWIKPDTGPPPEPTATNPLRVPSVAERTAVVLHVFGSLPVGQIAALTALPPGQVRQDLAHAETVLRQSQVEGGRT